MPPSYIYNIIFQTKERENIGKKPYLTTYQGAPQYEKIKNTEGKHPEISIIFDCNRFFLNQEEGVLNKYKIWSFKGLVKKQPPAA